MCIKHKGGKLSSCGCKNSTFLPISFHVTPHIALHPLGSLYTKYEDYIMKFSLGYGSCFPKIFKYAPSKFNPKRFRNYGSELYQFTPCNLKFCVCMHIHTPDRVHSLLKCECTIMSLLCPSKSYLFDCLHCGPQLFFLNYM